MFWKRSSNKRSKLHGHRLAEAVPPDLWRRVATLLLAAGIVASGLVIADAVDYVVIQVARLTDSPFLLDLVDLEGEPEDVGEDVDKGEQKEKPDEDQPKQEPKEDQPPTEDPPADQVVVNDQPRGPAQADVAQKRPGIIGHQSNGAAVRSLFSNRNPGAQAKALGKYGGDGRTQNAVRLGLEWLARHQEPDGSWSRRNFDRRCKPGHRCGGTGRYESETDPAMTGLAVLCYAAANCTHLGGRYKKTVARALDYLRSQQAENGRFGHADRRINPHMMYNQGIATFALAEVYAMTRDQSLRPIIEKAIQFSVRTQQLSGAWDYWHIPTGRYDTSVTGWQVMAFKSAHAAGIEIPTRTLFKLVRFIDSVTLPSGEVIYANANPGPGRKGPGMVAVGLASRVFLGFPVDDVTAQRQTALILEHPPDWKRLRITNPLESIYYWYYATIAMFQAGGKPWERWNTRMKKTLLLNQRRGGCVGGSWDPPNNPWGQFGGRLYATTLNILNLEIYYRYLPLYTGGALDTVPALIETAKTGRRADGVTAIRLLGKFKAAPARAFLLELAEGGDPRLAIEASVALAQRRDKAAVLPLLKQLESTNPYVRYRALRALHPMMDDRLALAFVGALRDPSTTVARQAAESLRQYAGLSFGFEPEASQTERGAAVEKWQAWWRQRRNGVVVTKGSKPWLVVGVDAGHGLVAFNTDEDRLKETGQELDVYRKDKYVGRIRVTKTDGSICVGKVITAYAADTFKSGDVVRRRK